MNDYTARLYENYARIGKCLASPRRVELLELLAQAPRSVEELSALTRMGIANTSQHLQHLRQARLVEAKKKGLYVFYRLASPAVQTLLAQVAELAQEQLAEVRQIEAEFLAQSEAWQSVSAAELKQRLQAGALLLDVRPAAEFAAGHIPGAVSMPLPELEKHIDTLPKDQDLIAYCRGPYCVFALEALQLLQAHGRQACHYRQGMAGWTTTDAAQMK